MRRRTALKIALVLILAFCANVGVAWTAAIATSRTGGREWRTLSNDEPMARWMIETHGMTDTPLLVREERGLGVKTTELSSRDPRIARVRNLLMYHGDGAHYTEREEDDARGTRLGERIAKFTDNPPTTTPGYFDFRWVESGWPFHGMRGGQRWIAKRDGVLGRPYWSYELVRDDEIMRDDVIPLRPIAAPFAINLLFYAAVLSFLFFAAPAIRRRHRRRRGRCAWCNYRLEGVGVCPECGGTVDRPASCDSQARCSFEGL